MRNLFIALILLFLTFSCSVFKGGKNIETKVLKYKIVELDSINDWYIIYASRNKNTYKIVSKKEKKCRGESRLEIGKSYKLYLYSKKENPPKMGNLIVHPVNNLDVQCYSYDENTEICIEPKRQIFDLFSAKNLEGLCYKE